MKKVVLLLSFAVLLSAAAQDSKSDSAVKTNAAIQISATEAKEHIGGFVLLEARDLREAIQLASRIPPARLGGVEVRQVIENPALEYWKEKQK